MVGSIYSLFPPLAVIIMVILTKNISLSIGSGILVGAMLLNGFFPGGAVETMTYSATSIFYDGEKINMDNVLLLIFIFALGVITAFVAKNGGAIGFARWEQSRVKSPAAAQLVAVFLGILIFIDDYFNALTVGEVARPLTDQQKVSREKLAYIIDSTTAPLNQFINTIPYNFYAIFALTVVFLSAALNINIGKMNDLSSIQEIMPWEKNDDDEEAWQIQGKERAFDLVIPILLLVSVSMTMMYITGYISSGSFAIMDVLSGASTYLSLVTGSAVALVFCAIRYYQLHGKHPIQIVQSMGLSTQMLYCCLGAVLSGSVLGDHCSPIADTTILSSAGAKCNYVDHVVSQLPYALFSGMIAAVGFFIIGFTASLPLAFVVQVIVLGAAALLYKAVYLGDKRRKEWTTA